MISKHKLLIKELNVSFLRFHRGNNALTLAHFDEAEKFIITDGMRFLLLFYIFSFNVWE